MALLSVVNTVSLLLCLYWSSAGLCHVTAIEWVGSVRCRGIALLESEDLALYSKRNEDCASHKGSTMIDMINLHSELRARTISHLQRLIELRIRT